MSKNNIIDEQDLQKGADSPTVHFINHESRISRLEAINEMIISTLVRLEKKLTRLENKIDSNFKWTVGIILTATIALFGVILNH